MKEIRVQLLGDAVNAPVLKMEGRRYPGVLIQGDSLNALCNLVRELVEISPDVETGDDSPRDLAEELESLLTGYRLVYEEVVSSLGLELPYSKRARDS